MALRADTPAGMGLCSLVRSDLERYLETFCLRGQTTSYIRVIVESFLFKSGFQAVFLYRLAHWLHRLSLGWPAWAISRLNQFLTGAEIEYNVQAGPGLFIAHPGGIVIGRGTRLGSKVTLFQGVSFGASGWGPAVIGAFPSVGDNVFVFAGAKVIGGIKVGSNVIIGANALARTDVPSGALIVAVSELKLGKGAEIIASWGLPLADVTQGSS